jgi:dipeptidyl aminopeptidase/acylaminoacyl peptidase
MKRIAVALFCVALLVGCGKLRSHPGKTLVEARQGFQSKLVDRGFPRDPVAEPPAIVFRKVSYPAAVGGLAAYLSPDPRDGQKHPAIIWITGGDCNSIDEVWQQAPRDNDQTASPYRDAGIVMMFPSLRGGNTNPGQREGYLGEVDDVIAAADYLSKQPYVDPDRIYLGGHSTGGTLVLLTAECTDRFRAVFCFGPVDTPDRYPDEYVPFQRKGPREMEVRSPGEWMHCVKTPTFVIEGEKQGNAECLRLMARNTSNPELHFLTVRGATHFSVLQPVNRLLAQKVMEDAGPSCQITVTAAELNGLFGR